MGMLVCTEYALRYITPPPPPPPAISVPPPPPPATTRTSTTEDFAKFAASNENTNEF